MRGLEELKPVHISETPSSAELKVLLYQFLGGIDDQEQIFGKMLASLQPDVQPDKGDLTSFSLQGVAIRKALGEAFREILQEKKTDPRYHIYRTATDNWKQDIIISHATTNGRKEITTTLQLDRDRNTLPLHITLTAVKSSAEQQSTPKIISLADFAARRMIHK
jgi:hypothetical protein